MVYSLNKITQSNNFLKLSESFKEMVENAHNDGCDLLVCHPGYLDAQILRTSSLTLDRTKEAEMLCSKELKDYLKEHDIHLYTYDEIGH